jgi:hypothetical protein
VITLDHVGKRRIFTYSWVRDQWFAGCLSIPVAVRDKLEELSSKIDINFSIITRTTLYLILVKIGTSYLFGLFKLNIKY